MREFTVKYQTKIALSEAEIKFIKNFDPASWKPLKSSNIFRSLKDKKIYEINYLDFCCYLTEFGKKLQKQLLKTR